MSHGHFLIFGHLAEAFIQRRRAGLSQSHIIIRRLTQKTEDMDRTRDPADIHMLKRCDVCLFIYQGPPGTRGVRGEKVNT